MAFCIHCGAKLGDNDRFCGICGNRAAAAAPAPAPAAQPSATVIYRPAAPESTVPAPAEEAPVSVAPVAEAPAAEPAAVTTVTEAPAAEPVSDAPTGEKTVFTAPIVGESTASEPLYAAPITREHIRSAATPAGAQPMPFGNKSARGSSASYSYATPDRVANPVKNQAVRPKRKFLAAFFSVILCILLLIAMLPSYVLVTVRSSLSKETVQAMMYRVDLDQIPASFIDEYDSSLRGLSIAEALCDELNSQMHVAYDDWDDLTPKELDQYLDETAFIPFIAEHAEGILHALVEGEDSYRIPTKEIITLLEHDVHYLADTLNLPMEEVDLDELSDDIVDEFGLEDVVLPAPDDIDENAQLALDGLGILLSFYAIGGVCLVLLLLVLLLFAANHRDPMYAVRDVGIVSILGTVLPLLLVPGARGAVAYFAGKEAEIYLASLATSCVLESSFPVIASVFILGVVLLIVNGIVRGVQKKRAQA